MADLKVDAGPIIAYTKQTYKKTQGDYYEITYTQIKDAIEEYSNITRLFFDQKLSATPQRKVEQKYLYKKSDFNEEALEEVLNKYE